MSDLDTIRQEIDEIDEKILSLLSKRPDKHAASSTASIRQWLIRSGEL